MYVRYSFLDKYLTDRNVRINLFLVVYCYCLSEVNSLFIYIVSPPDIISIYDMIVLVIHAHTSFFGGRFKYVHVGVSIRVSDMTVTLSSTRSVTPSVGAERSPKFVCQKFLLDCRKLHFPRPAGCI